MLGSLAAATTPVEPLPEAVPPEHWIATVGVFYPFATHYGHAEVTSSFDLNLLYSRVGSIDGGQLGGVNVVGRDVGPPASMRGLQVGVLANVVAGDARGVQLSLGTNLTKGSVEGLQSALLFNRAGSVDGLQLSLVNVAGDLDGVRNRTGQRRPSRARRQHRARQYRRRHRRAAARAHQRHADRRRAPARLERHRWPRQRGRQARHAAHLHPVLRQLPPHL